MLSKLNRINKKSEFDRFFGISFKRGGGRSSSTKNLLIKALPGATGWVRVGFIINTKVDNRASVRNLLKRRLRAIAKETLLNQIPPQDFLFVVMPGLKVLTPEELKLEVSSIIKRLQLLK
jgi:ribonuclease P protein component